MPCFITYEVDGHVVGEPARPVETPFVRAAVRLTRLDLLRGLVRGAMRVVVTVNADADTVAAFDAAVTYPQPGLPVPPADRLHAAGERFSRARRELADAEENMNRVLDEAHGA